MNRYIRSRRTWIAAFAVAALGIAGAAALPACQQGRQGDRCNPALVQTNAATSPNGGQYNEDECGSGLSCTVPPTCVIAVCCPSAPPYTDPNCACLANPGAQCACTVQELDGAPWVSPSEDAASNDAGSVDTGTNDAGTVDAGVDSGSVDSGHVDANAPADAPSDGPTDAQNDAAG
jgi:hypothetical protein